MTTAPPSMASRTARRTATASSAVDVPHSPTFTYAAPERAAPRAASAAVPGRVGRSPRARPGAAGPEGGQCAAKGAGARVEDTPLDRGERLPPEPLDMRKGGA